MHRTGTSCTAVAFNLRNPSEFLIGMPDFTVKCFDAGKIHWIVFLSTAWSESISDKKEFVAWLKGHTTPVKEISVDSNGDFGITTSAEIAFLWDLKSFERKRKLTITNKNDVCLFRVRIALPETMDCFERYSFSGILLSCFQLYTDLFS